jgi:hypothetical protein
MAFERPHIGRKEAKSDRAAAVAVVDAVDQRRQFLAPVIVGREEVRLMLTGGEPPDYRPGVPLESAEEVSSCDDTASPSGSDALSISAAICSCWAIVFWRCSFNQPVVASARSLRARAAAAR